jgi:hypothetical protein
MPCNANPAKDLRQIPLLSRSIHQSARRERRCVECAKATPAYSECEDSRACAARDLLAEGNGDGVAAVYDRDREDEVVAEIGEDVGDDYDGEGCVDDAGEVAGVVYEFAGYVVDL